MARIEDLTKGATVQGVLPDGLVTVVDVKWHGSSVAELTYKDAAGCLGNELLYRDREPTLAFIQIGRPWEPRYVRRPFQREPNFGVTSVNYKLAELLSRSEPPA